MQLRKGPSAVSPEGDGPLCPHKEILRGFIEGLRGHIEWEGNVLAHSQEAKVPKLLIVKLGVGFLSL